MPRLMIGCLLWTGLVQAQVITTVAGGGTPLPESGVPAVNVPLRGVSAVAVDGGGNLYVADRVQNIVGRVSPDGVLVIVAGNGLGGFSADGGSASKASISYPNGLAADPAGNLYIADRDNFRIRKVAGGAITTVAGNGKAGFSGDGGPAIDASIDLVYGVAVDSNGNLYISDTYNNRIRKVSGGVITTVAGNGAQGYSGDGGPATSASLNGPFGLALDSAGNLYIDDLGNNRIRKVAGGVITTVAGNGAQGYSGDGGPAASAALQNPGGIAVDLAGNLYIADTDNCRVRKVSGGTITTVAGDGVEGHYGDGGPAVSAALLGPVGVAVDSTGNLFIADSGNDRVRKVSGGTITTVAGSANFFTGDGGPATGASLAKLTGVAVDSAGNLYIADSDNNRVRKVSGGVITTAAGNGIDGFSGDGGLATNASLLGPSGVAVDSNGNLYIADSGNNRIRKVSGGTITTVAGNGDDGFSGDGVSAISASLSYPTGAAVDSAGNLYIADSGNHRVRRVSAGTITTVAGNGVEAFSGDGGLATSASLSDPRAVAVDSAGSLYIADTGNSRVRKVSGGTITTLAGKGAFDFTGDGGPAAQASLAGPKGMALDSAGNLYIADRLNNRIRKVSGGIITTVAGSDSETFAGDGGPATSASLSNPEGVAVDSAGNIYIGDTNNSRVRVVLAGRVSYQVSPATLTFSGQAGGISAGGQVVSLSSTVPGIAFTASASAGWLAVTPASGTIPSNLQVTADPSNLSAGTYQATVTIAVLNGTPAVTTINASFSVQPANPPSLGVSTESITFTGSEGGGALSQTLQVQDTGGGSLPFTAVADTSSGGSWLSISESGGAATPSAPASISVVATPGSLAAGTYYGTVTVTGAGRSIVIPVTLSLSAPIATILLSQSALSFTAVAQGGVPLPQNFGILNTGQGSMSWTAEATTLTGGNWLTISPSSGTVPRPFLDVSLVTVAIDPSTLEAGIYYGRIQVSAVAVNTPQFITVVLTVLPPGSTLPAQIFPVGLIFTGTAGVTPESQDVQVGNPSGRLNSFISGMIGTGYTYLPTSASVLPNQPATVRVYPDFRHLSAGTQQRGTITLQFSDGSPSQNISVLMVVAPSGTALLAQAGSVSLAAQPAASGCGVQGLFMVFRTPQPSQTVFNAVVGQPTTLEVQLSDGCGNLIGPGGQNAAVAASFSSRDSVSMTHIGKGVWQGTWRPLSPGTVNMLVTAFLVQSNAGILGGQSPTLTALVSAPATPTPSVTAKGVVHAASAQGGVPIAPGGLISIYGVNLSDSSGQSTTLPLPQQLNGTRVLLGNQPLPILYTNSGQLNVQVPYGVPVDTQYQLMVQRGNELSVPQQLVVAKAQPGIFTVNQQGSGQGSIVKSDGVTLAQSGTPASIGETVVIYCTGLGAVTPKVQDGAPAPVTPPLSTTDNPVNVKIGDKAATVIFGGLTPGSAGLYQINAVVPSGIATGDAVPVVISVAGQTSPVTPPVTMAVK